MVLLFYLFHFDLQLGPLPGTILISWFFDKKVLLQSVKNMFNRNINWMKAKCIVINIADKDIKSKAMIWVLCLVLISTD